MHTSTSGRLPTKVAGSDTSPSTARPAPVETDTVPTASPVLLQSLTGPPGSAFVGRSGTTLTLQGKPYRFTGINIYMAASGATPSSCGGELYPNIGTPLSQMPRGTVVRFWAFQNFFVSHGSFNWANLDQVLSIAQANGDKVIPVLANQYDYCDTAKDLPWFQSGYRTQVEQGDLVTYRDYVKAIVSRYSGNTTIAMWQLVNEGEAVNSDGSCQEAQALAALLGFARDIGGLVHILDPNHLVSLGTVAGYSGSGSQWCGAMNGDYQTLMASSGIDVCDYHDYGYPGDPLGMPNPPNLTSATQMCRADGKPMMVGETGILADNPLALLQRAAEFRVKFQMQFLAGVSGELMWCWAVKPDYVIPDSDADYGIAPGDPALSLLGVS
jgi:mannan endo-1,4-beta-mannosidase